MRLGWSEKGISTFLGEPDLKKPGFKNSKGGSRKLYLRERVLAAEGTVKFHEFVRKNKPKVEAGRKSWNQRAPSIN